MTKRDNPKEIIRNMVIEARKTLDLYSDVYGFDSEITNYHRMRWCLLDYLWRKIYDEEY